MPDAAPLAVSLAGIPLRNPVLLAAGTHGTLDDIADVLDLSRIGGLVAKSVTPLPREGNPTYRILDARAGAGMLNAVGLANPGIEAFERDHLPRAATLPCAVIASVAGFSVDDYLQVCATFNDWGRGTAPEPSPRGRGLGVGSASQSSSSDVSRAGSPPTSSIQTASDPQPILEGVELNVSCPNVKAGCTFVSSNSALAELLTEVRKVLTRTRLIVKLSPFPDRTVELAKAAVDCGADALTISNTIPAMAIDLSTRRPRLSHVTGGLSGPGLHPVAVKLVFDTYRAVCKDARGPGQSVPIIGAGGVLTWEDAAEFILAGASAVQMGTALFVDPRSPLAVARGLERWVRAQKCANIAELVGAVQLQ